MVAEEVGTAAVWCAIEGVIADGNGNRFVRIDDGPEGMLAGRRGCRPPAPCFAGIQGDGKRDILRMPDDGFSRCDFDGGVVLNGHNVKACWRLRVVVVQVILKRNKKCGSESVCAFQRVDVRVEVIGWVHLIIGLDQRCGGDFQPLAQNRIGRLVFDQGEPRRQIEGRNAVGGDRDGLRGKRTIGRLFHGDDGGLVKRSEAQERRTVAVDSPNLRSDKPKFGINLRVHATEPAQEAGHQHEVHQGGEPFQIQVNQLVGAR